jgi:hypothetical protein
MFPFLFARFSFQRSAREGDKFNFTKQRDQPQQIYPLFSRLYAASLRQKNLKK